MTVMFCDLVGSSALAAQLDPEEYAELLVVYRESCATAVSHQGGYISRYAGDGVIACFGYPRAVGRDAQAAVECGLSIAQLVSALAQTTPLPGGSELAVRIGIESGLVLAGRLGPGSAMELDALVGTAPNTAARLQEVAERNGVLIGEATYELVADDFDCEEVPAERLTRLQPPARAFVVRSPAKPAGRQHVLTRRRGPFVGRAAEFNLLRERWENAKSGQGQTALVSGEAGIGKSRLCQEFLNDLTDTPHRCVLLTCAPQSSSSPFYPAIEALRQELNASTGRPGDRDASLDALSELARRLGIQGGAAETLLAQALGLDPAAVDLAPVVRRRLLRESLQAWLLNHNQPILILAEDLHWSDPSLLELLNQLTELLVTRRIMLLATYRSDFALPWPDRPTTLRVPLAPLGRPEAEQLIAALSRHASADTRNAILSRSDGVPLFVEEFSLAAGGPDVPRTLQQLFTARLDALGETKRLAQCAAMLGPQIEPDILSALADVSEAEVEAGLDALVNAELLVRTSPPPSPSFAFRHALLQDAAANSALLADRRAMHRHAAALLPIARPAMVDQRPEILARHFELGGQPDRAVPLYAEAARRALEAAALQEAEAHVGSGLALLGAIPNHGMAELELDLRVLLGHVLIARRGYASAAVQDAFERALALAEHLPEEARTLPALRGLTSFYQVRGPLSRAKAVCARLVIAAERENDALLLVDALRRRGWNSVCMGSLVEGERDLTRALESFDPLRRDRHIAVSGHDPEILALANIAWLSVPRNGPLQAAQWAMRAAAAARVSHHAMSACYGLALSALVLQQADQWDDALDLANLAMSIAAEKGIAYWVSLSQVAIGFDRAARRGDMDTGIDAIRTGLAGYRETQGELLRPFILALLARAEALAGQVEAARASLREATEVAEALDAHGFVPALLLQSAHLAVDHHSGPKSRGMLEAALESARRQGADAIASAALGELERTQG